jgi:hypothetical protein
VQLSFRASVGMPACPSCRVPVFEIDQIKTAELLSWEALRSKITANPKLLRISRSPPMAGTDR